MSTAKVQVAFGGQTLIIESGKLAKQANGAVTVTVGGTIVLVTACMAKKPREGFDFFPLTVEYQEKTYSAGRIPGGFFKREGRPTEKEVLTSRVIDRPIRPLFPEGCRNEVQVVATVLSHDGENDADVLAMIGASAALTISDIPFDGPIGAARVGLIDGQLVANPTYEQRQSGSMDLVVAGWGDGIVMIEGEADQVPEAKVLEGLKFALAALKSTKDIQLELQKKVGKPKVEVKLKTPGASFVAKVRSLAMGRLEEIYKGTADKDEREDAVGALAEQLAADLTVYADCAQEGREIGASDVAGVFEQLQYEVIRGNVYNKNLRADGSGPKDIRDISCEAGV
ncbi:MAG: polyribonucleotide nucleotidyltransferase, partial [Candidatus Omnitrophota bacterium]|nr:polyribonucleotide nucleotidyltransferase [Candidatus Omnitrophota bacterium]